MKVKNKKTLYQPIKVVDNNNVIVMWDYKPIIKVNAMGETVETPLAIWQEARFNYIPSLTEIKSTILSHYNQEIEYTIKTGLKWKGMQVWLTTENQFNYKAAYDLAVQTKGATLPLSIKLGNDDNVVYYEFKTLDDFSDFYFSAMNHVQKTLSEGWKKKDNIKWELYEIK